MYYYPGSHSQYNFMLRQNKLMIDDPPIVIIQDITPEMHEKAEEMLKKIKEDYNHGEPISE